ncbi:MAG: hypothetical protein OH319_05020 [Candidatus Parvarchaeota archaeon]|nr:hypothetical protein [Candidatus Jingweiarchaeum tengchongense]MCW1297697.1 hypothetical protein [Candidatus Jingweiarchaeum tengchongense]MCW1299708.1 hypothetical protein [Candidatus Jingweiarchaeum tengchongense]MCW1304324.1 hypothetical protein [Candidatus Jingweiarchaeum tengchongense]MCW1305693.1 hypothetical protein [Candidatus Jingweiarchaeum tengchongense]
MEEEAREYVNSINKNGLKAAFTYGDPAGKDIDLCIVSEKPELITKPPEGIDLKVLKPKEFEEKLNHFGKQAVEFRTIIGKEYLADIIKKLSLKISLK